MSRPQYTSTACSSAGRRGWMVLGGRPSARSRQADGSCTILKCQTNGAHSGGELTKFITICSSGRFCKFSFPTICRHSHLMVQYGEGLAGALIIRNKFLEPYRFEVDAEYNVLLTDWWIDFFSCSFLFFFLSASWLYTLTLTILWIVYRYHNSSLSLLNYYLSPASNGNEVR